MAHAFGPLYTVIRYKTDRGGEPDRRGSSVSLSLYGACTPYGGGCPVRTEYSYACERAIGWGYRGMSAVDLI